MENESEHIVEPPLPAEWLPAPAAAHDDPSWDALRNNIMMQAEPALRSLSDERNDDLPWVDTLGTWWTGAAAVLAIAATLLLVIRPAVAPTTARQPDVALDMIATDGKPATLWTSFGIEADPVLALMAYQAVPR
ncbi:MAG: hypothetical protein ABIV28_08635 [Longimicrobiales bacterium]